MGGSSLLSMALLSESVPKMRHLSGFYCGRRWPLKIRQLRDICFQQDKENIVFIMIVSRGRLQRTTCFHTTVRIYTAKSEKGCILYRKCCFHYGRFTSQITEDKMLNYSQNNFANNLLFSFYEGVFESKYYFLEEITS